MNRSRTRRSRAGLSNIELMLVFGLIGIIGAKLVAVVSSANDVLDTGSRRIRIDDQARDILDRIAIAIMGADRETLTPIMSPDYSTGMRYQASLGMVDGEVVWSNLEEITLSGESELCWRENPGQAGERSVVWSKDVLPLLLGEEANGVDDNDNGLVDEEGLNFVVDGNQIVIRLSLGVFEENGRRVERHMETRVTCRNNPLD